MAHLIAAELRRTAQQVQTKLLMMRCANRHCEARPLQREHPQSGAHPTWSLQAHPAQRAGPLATGGRSGAAPASAPPPQRAECTVIDRGPGRWRAYRRCFRAPSRVSSCSCEPKTQVQFCERGKSCERKVWTFETAMLPPGRFEIGAFNAAACDCNAIALGTTISSASSPRGTCLWGTVRQPHDQGQGTGKLY